MTHFYKVYHSYPKVNIFLKIVGTRLMKEGSEYSLLSSRFMLLDDPFDAMWFEQTNSGRFEIAGEFNCALQDNLIYKAYRALVEAYPNKKIVDFCKSHRVKVYKRIPTGAGLGGGSSNAATFLKMINETLNLGINVEELARIGQSVGADVPFFVYGYPSANVSGIGEIVEPFEEEKLNLEIYTPHIHCDTASVYKAFRKNLIEYDLSNAADLEKMKSDVILRKYDAFLLNDLMEPAFQTYPELYDYKKDGWFFSGSGSSFFRQKQ